ncbi:MAG: ABC transporter permease [Geovibrio sp.]|jgi:phospholipid/cholesterol/gamma-HCH transport system permease protein|uniref:MlaE family ABC transporter permease n=1 Tax=Geovibrio ferrireducens TaxID=46201 RepID=UPI0022472D86|nr:ABC transporter permease [Geovibrio ferrireducens]MCD8568447.1 ABC transporter permease [Geovibrio sp.]
MNGILAFIGRPFTVMSVGAGRLFLLFWETLRVAFVPPYRFRLFIKQVEFIGVNSLSVIILTGSFTGMVFAFQSYIGFSKFGAEYLVGTVVTLGMARELGPVLSAIMVAARAGSAITAEIGTMKVTEQIDALSSLAVDPVQYLFVPRILAGVFVMPLLNAVAVFCGTVGGIFVGVTILGINKTLYMENMYRYIDLSDFINGMVKSVVFGLLVTLVGCYKGYYTSGGAEGVGKATTESVVLACILILVFDYILTAFMF